MNEFGIETKVRPDPLSALMEAADKMGIDELADVIVVLADRMTAGELMPLGNKLCRLADEKERG